MFVEEQFDRSFSLTQKMIKDTEQDFLRQKQKQQDALEKSPDPFANEEVDPKIVEWMEMVLPTPPGKEPKEERKLRKEIVKQLKKEKRQARNKDSTKKKTQS